MKRVIAIGACIGMLAFGMQSCGGDDESPPSTELPGEISKADAETLIGMTESTAKEQATSNGWGFRVGRRDEHAFALTADYSPTRVTVEIDEGLVTKVTVG